MLPPLNAMIKIVRTEMSVRALSDSERSAKPGRAAHATFQDNDDGSGEEKPKQESSARKKNPKNKREKWGCGFVTKKPADKQCPSHQECDVANGQLWPDEQDRTADWKKALYATAEERLEFFGLSYEMIQRLSGHPPCLTFPRGYGRNVNASASGGFSNFETDWKTGMQLLFD